MKISVNEQTQIFYLATEKWLPMVGHEISVGEFRFCAIPGEELINISEVTSGCKVFDIPLDIGILMQTSTKEDTIAFFHKVGESLRRIINRRPNFCREIECMKQIAFEKLGEIPPVKDVDTDWMFKVESDVVH